MIAKEYAMVADEIVINDIHPLAASPNAHYLITKCVLYLYGHNFHEQNPWSLKLLFKKEPSLLTALDDAKVFFVQSEKDMELLKNISTTTVNKHRNVFLDPDRALDIFGRIPNCERIMSILYKIHRDARMLYPHSYNKLLKFHTETVARIDDATTNKIVRPPKHACMKPCSRSMCVEAHPIVRVPTVGPLPAPSAPMYAPVRTHVMTGAQTEQATAVTTVKDTQHVRTTDIIHHEPVGAANTTRSGPSRPRRNDGFHSPPRDSTSCMQASCVNTPPEPAGTNSPKKVEKRELLMSVIQDIPDSKTMVTIITTLKTIGQLGENEPDEYHTLLDLVNNTTCEEDLKLIATVMYGGNMKKKLKLI
tara:strand:- start:10955 stop:12040 length:1086 start_codon:yes stop_codon:yes gene_type:complete